jgi:hypothetical protein
MAIAAVEKDSSVRKKEGGILRGALFVAALVALLAKEKINAVRRRNIT